MRSFNNREPAHRRRGVVTSGFTFPRIDGYYREIVKGVIIVSALIADQYRQRKRGRG